MWFSLIAEKDCCLILRSHESSFSLRSCLGTLVSFSEIVSASVVTFGTQLLCVFPTCCKLNMGNLLSRSEYSLLLNVPVICELMSEPSEWQFIWFRRLDIGFMPLLTLRINDGVTSFAIGCLIFITLNTCVGRFVFFRYPLLFRFVSSPVEYLIRDCDSGLPRSPQRTVCFGN